MSQPSLLESSYWLEEWEEFVHWDAMQDDTSGLPFMDQTSESLRVASIGVGPQHVDSDHMPQTPNPDSVITCQQCHQNFGENGQLSFHAWTLGHLAYQCQLSACNESFVSSLERDAHEATPHNTEHHRVHSEHPFQCTECKETFYSKADLLRHAKEQQHKPYACDCGTLFSRVDVLNRHLKSFATDIPQHPCKLCKFHRGAAGFRRKDHLLQHLRQYHHVNVDITGEDAEHQTLTAVPSRLKFLFPTCTHLDCPQYRPATFQQLSRSMKEAAKPFKSQSEYTKHMREEHDECAFPCDVFGCTRVGRKGYFREKDLIKHRRQEHPDKAPYKPTSRAKLFHCTEPGCGDVIDFSSIKKHYDYHSRKTDLAEACA
ncbi:amp-binding enzyme protein [Rutstroemia sp. NJR-2017a WRK4]|nr:amp-binding enzyme protein [Rutstroemia sp. NJR-2017a WRK4]